MSPAILPRERLSLLTGEAGALRFRARARLSSGPLARLAAAVLRAEAFVVGRHVFLSGRAAGSIASRSPAGLALLVHELVHVEQYRRHGVWRFLRRYLSEYLAGLARGRTHLEAYAAIAFEREAVERAMTLRGASLPAPAAGAVSPEGSLAGPPHGG